MQPVQLWFKNDEIDEMEMKRGGKAQWQKHSTIVYLKGRRAKFQNFRECIIFGEYYDYYYSISISKSLPIPI
jgi:hypothetical protein